MSRAHTRTLNRTLNWALKRPLAVISIAAIAATASGCTAISVATTVVGTTVSVATTAVNVGVAVGSTAVNVTTSAVKGAANVASKLSESSELKQDLEH